MNSEVIRSKVLAVVALFVLPFNCMFGNETNGVAVYVPAQKVTVAGNGSLNEALSTEAKKCSFEPYKGECEEVGIALGEAADEAGKLFYLALAYEYGECGLKQDYTKAMRLYREAAAAGSAVAMGNLGLMYKYGKGVVSNDVRAVYWFKKAADAGDSLGMHNWALAEAFGKGTERNLFGAKCLLLLNDKYEPSAKWLRALIKEQDITSGFALAVKEHDDRNAARWCAERYENEYSAEFDLCNAARYYGAYFYGKDFIVSSQSFLDRNENGPSNSKLGEMLKGNPITNVNVIVELARAYANSKYRMQDLSVSDMLYFHLLNKMDLHDDSLNKELEEEYAALKNEMVEAAYVRNRAFNGDIDAMVELGRRYLEGRGVSYNYPTSIAWFKAAINAQQQPVKEGQSSTGVQKPGQSAQGFWSRVAAFVKVSWRGVAWATTGAGLAMLIYLLIAFVVKRIHHWWVMRRFNARLIRENARVIREIDSETYVIEEEKDVDMEDEDSPIPSSQDVKPREEGK